MGIFSKTKRGIVWLFALKPSKWIDYQNLKQTASYLFELGRSFYQIPSANQNETFEEAVEKLNLTDTDLELRFKNFSFLIYFFLFLSLLIGCYFFWLALHGHFMGSCMSFAIMVYSLSLAFRYHFWRYQLQRRKLGCTTQEWLNDLLNKPPKITSSKGESR